jgi:hypothetical protein
MSLEVIFCARAAEEHDDLLRVSALRHGVLTLGKALAAPAFWTHDAGASASSDASASCYSFAENIGILPVVVAELEFSEVERQILLADMMKAPHNSALEQGPERFQIVGMDLAAYVLARAMANSFMRITKSLQIAITAMLVCSDQIDFFAYCLAYESIEGSRVRIFDNLADDISLPADGPDDSDLAAPNTASYVDLLIPMSILVLPADESLVHFDDSHKLAKVWIVHRGAQAMAHIPRRAIVTTSNLPLNLKRADSLLGVEYLPENLEPSLKRVVRVLKDGSCDDREPISIALPTFLIRALPFPRLCNLVNVIGLATSWTYSFTIRPTPFHEELFTGFVGREGGHQFSEGHHGMKDSRLRFVRQVPQNRPN